MPGFGNNTQRVQGEAVTPSSTGSVRIGLEPSILIGAPGTPPRQNTGTPILASGSATIHKASLTALDEVYLWASNNGISDSELTLSLRTRTSDDDLEFQRRIVTTLKSKVGLQLVYPGIPHTNNDTLIAEASGNPAFTPATNIVVCGFVMRRFRETTTDPSQGFDGQE